MDYLLGMLKSMLGFIAIMGFVTLLQAAVNKFKQPPASKPVKRTLEEKLAILQQCGIELAHPFTVEDLLKVTDRSNYEEADWGNLLGVLGTENEEEPFIYHSKNVWHFDTECIEDHGAYKDIVERMVEMAQGSLPLEDIEDYVDVGEGMAWVSFVFNGNKIKIDFVVNDDWVDEEVFSKLIELLNLSDPSKIYISYSSGGQDLIIACVTQEQYELLRDHGINFVPHL